MSRVLNALGPWRQRGHTIHAPVLVSAALRPGKLTDINKFGVPVPVKNLQRVLTTKPNLSSLTKPAPKPLSSLSLNLGNLTPPKIGQVGSVKYYL